MMKIDRTLAYCTGLLVALSVACCAVATAGPASSDGDAAAQKITLAQFVSLRAQADHVVLDVRTPREFAAGHVPGAVNIDWHARDFNDQVGKLDKTKHYLVHCAAGMRSAAAVKRMGGLGFTHLYDFAGGWSEYSKSGESVEK